MKDNQTIFSRRINQIFTLDCLSLWSSVVSVLYCRIDNKHLIDHCKDTYHHGYWVLLAAPM